ncbi:MAG: hypothetical protein PHP54_02890 [Clostridia bacterium]|nr:hypothetical protein [Clostridia bacterium]
MEISDYVSTEIILMVSMIIVLLILVRLVFKFISMPKLVKGLLLSATGVGIFLLVNSYIAKEEQMYLTEPKNYIVGKIDFVSKTLKKASLDSVSYSGKLIGNVVIKIPNNTQIYIEESGVKKKTNIDALKTGCKVTVNVQEKVNTKEKEDMTAVKILIKVK